MSQALVPFTNEQLSVIRTTVAKTTTEDEFKLFIEVCKYHNLNPFARQIYAVVRTGNSGRQMSIQTSIDGYRLLAERSGKYAGQIGPEWCGEDGKWVDVWLSDKPPAAARIGVLRKDFAQPTWGVAKYKSYAQNTPIWTKMPDTMLAKCAEALALRKAFPAEMSGIYTAEEMAQADNDAPMPTVHVEPTANASDAKIVVGEIVTQNQEPKVQSEVKDLSLMPTSQPDTTVKAIHSEPQPPSKDRLLKRQDNLCLLAIAKGEVEKGTSQETADSFFKFCTKVLGATISSRGHLTASRLDTIEKYLKDKIVAKAS